MILLPPEAPLPLIFDNNGKRFLILHQHEPVLLWTAARTHVFHHHPTALGWDLTPEEAIELIGGPEEFYLTAGECLAFYDFTKQHTYGEVRVREMIERYDIDHVFLRRADMLPDSAMLMIADLSDPKYHAEVNFLYGLYLESDRTPGRQRIEANLANPRHFFPALLRQIYDGGSVAFAPDSIVDSFIVRTRHITNDLAARLGIRWRIHSTLQEPRGSMFAKIDECLTDIHAQIAKYRP